MAAPRVNDRVHYVSYGTPGGEYRSQCRAATVAEVGAWMPMGDPYDEGRNQAGQKLRTRTEVWEPQACALVVHNPTGLFFNTCSRHEPDPESLTRGGITGVRRVYHGGTWHQPDGCEA